MAEEVSQSTANCTPNRQDQSIKRRENLNNSSDIHPLLRGKSIELKKEIMNKNDSNFTFVNDILSQGDNKSNKTLPLILSRPSNKKKLDESGSSQVPNLKTAVTSRAATKGGKRSSSYTIFDEDEFQCGKPQANKIQTTQKLESQPSQNNFSQHQNSENNHNLQSNNADTEPQKERRNSRRGDTTPRVMTVPTKSKILSNYTSFQQSLKGGGPKIGKSELYTIIGMKKSYGKLDTSSQKQSEKQSSIDTPMKERPTTDQVQNKQKEQQNRLYNMEEEIDENEHQIVNFNPHYQLKPKAKKPQESYTTTAINFYKNSILERKLQLTKQLAEHARQIEAEKQTLNAKKPKEVPNKLPIVSQTNYTTLRIKKADHQFNKDQFKGSEQHEEEPSKLLSQSPIHLQQTTPSQNRTSRVRVDTFDNMSQNTINLTQLKSTKSESSKTKQELDNYKLGPQIGKGSYAIVRIATESNSGEQVAIKFYDKFKLFDPQKKKNVQREIAILSKVSHPHCIEMKKTFENTKSICVVMEYVGKDSLHTYLKTFQGRKLPEDEAKRLFKQIIKGMSYLHENSISHRDIKLENLLLDDSKNIKIIDFGFSIVSPKDKKLNVFCGTPSYMAPEIVQKKDYYGGAVDIWACGILLFVMLVGTFPFKAAEEKTLYHKISQGMFEIPSHVSTGASQLLKKVLNPDYHKRATADEILQDTWVSPMNIGKKISELKEQISHKPFSRGKGEND